MIIASASGDFRNSLHAFPQPMPLSYRDAVVQCVGKAVREVDAASCTYTRESFRQSSVFASTFNRQTRTQCCWRPSLTVICELILYALSEFEATCVRACQSQKQWIFTTVLLTSDVTGQKPHHFHRNLRTGRLGTYSTLRSGEIWPQKTQMVARNSIHLIRPQ